MSHKPIHINTLSLLFPHKICFEDFSAQVFYGNRIAIIGANGSGKSTLLKILMEIIEPTRGQLTIPSDLVRGYVPQLIEKPDLSIKNLSGGELFNQQLTEALKIHPNILLFDEPTNHLDKKNRQGLEHMIKNYPGTIIVASHDVTLLQNHFNVFWHIHDEKISVFSGCYDNYLETRSHQQISIFEQLDQLKKEKKATHQAFTKEQSRAAKSRRKGEKSIQERKWPTVVSKAKALRAGETSGRKKSVLKEKKRDLIEELSHMRPPEILKPTFSLSAQATGNKSILSIQDGSVGYGPVICKDIYLTLHATSRIAIQGENGSGKTTLLKAILGQDNLIKSGKWTTPHIAHVGYLDQHYRTLQSHMAVLKTLENVCPDWDHKALRCHLNDFLFRKNEEVHMLVKLLSGGEKVRLSLALIAAKPPKLLILDEITNNVDIETRQHIIQVLKSYPGAMIFVSHDEGFLQDLDIQECYDIKNGVLTRI